MRVSSSRSGQPHGSSFELGTPEHSSFSGGTGLDDEAVYGAQLTSSRMPVWFLETSLHQKFASELRRVATDEAQFHRVVKQVLGPDYDVDKANELLSKLLAGDVSWLPPIRFALGETVAGLGSAYDAAKGIVFFDGEMRNDYERLVDAFARGAQAFLKDALAARGSSDADGEELSRLVLGGAPWVNRIELSRPEVTPEHNSRLTAPNVEKPRSSGLWGVFSWIGEQVSGIARGVSDAFHGVARVFRGIADALEHAGHLLGRAAEELNSRLQEAWTVAGKELWRELNRWAKDGWQIVADSVHRLRDAVRTLGGGVTSAAVGVLRNMAELSQQLAKGVGQLVEGQSEGWQNLGIALLKVPQTVGDAALIVGGSAVSGVQTLLHLEPVRRELTDEEVARLQRVFGDSIDYDAIVVKQGTSGVLTTSGRPFVMGNTIYLPYRGATDFGTLAHEVTHVWQHQNGGTDYASEALLARYVFAAEEHEAYDWTRSAPTTPWGDLNPEQQGAFIEAAVNHGAFDREPASFASIPYGFTGTLDELNDYLSGVLVCLRTGTNAP